MVCAKLVHALGHEVAWISPPGPDGGLDFVAFADPIGATGRRIKGQAKRQQSKQDVGDVGAFLSKLKGDDVGVSSPSAASPRMPRWKPEPTSVDASCSMAPISSACGSSTMIASTKEPRHCCASVRYGGSRCRSTDAQRLQPQDWRIATQGRSMPDCKARLRSL